MRQGQAQMWSMYCQLSLRWEPEWEKGKVPHPFTDSFFFSSQLWYLELFITSFCTLQPVCVTANTTPWFLHEAVEAMVFKKHLTNLDRIYWGQSKEGIVTYECLSHPSNTCKSLTLHTDVCVLRGCHTRARWSFLQHGTLLWKVSFSLFFALNCGIPSTSVR